MQDKMPASASGACGGSLSAAVLPFGITPPFGAEPLYELLAAFHAPSRACPGNRSAAIHAEFFQ
jgi:hypothetical protein